MSAGNPQDIAVHEIICSVTGFPNNKIGSSTDQIGEIHPGQGQVLLGISFTAERGAASDTPAVALV